MDEAENCERIAIIDHGEIVASDTPEALKAAVGKDRIELHVDDPPPPSPSCATLRDRCRAHRRIRRLPRRGRGGVRAAAARASSTRRPARSGSRDRRSMTSSWPTPDARSATPRPPASERLRRGHDPRRRGCVADGDDHPAPIAVREPGGRLRDELPRSRVVWRRELLRFARNRMRMVTSLVQPLLFLLILGTGLSSMLPSERRRQLSRHSCSPGSSR